MLDVTDECIELKKISSKDEYDMIKKSLNKDDYNNFIGNKINDFSDAFCFYYENILLGFCGLNIINKDNQIIANPYIYLYKRIPNLSICCLLKLITYIFNVYSNNKHMINILDKLQVKREGIFKQVTIKEGLLVDKYVYSILKEDFQIYRRKINDYFGYGN